MTPVSLKARSAEPQTIDTPVSSRRVLQPQRTRRPRSDNTTVSA